MGKYSRLLKNSSLVIIGNVGTRLISFIVLPFYTYWLLTDEYGTVDLISTYILLLSGVVTLGLPEALFRFPKGQIVEKQRKYITSSFCVIFLLSALTLIIFLLINYFWKANNIFTDYVYYIYAILVLSSIQSSLLQLSRGLDRMSIYVITGLIGAIANVSLAFILVPRYNVVGCLVSQISSIVITIVYLSISLNLKYYIGLKYYSNLYLKQLLAYSIPLIPNAIFWWLIDASNKLFLEKYSGLSAVGIFALANKFPTLLQGILSLFFVSWQISCVEEYRSPSFYQFYNKVCRSVFVSTLFLALLAVIITNVFIIYVLSDNYIDSIKYLPILYSSMAFSVMSTFFAINFTTYKRTNYLFYTTFVGAFMALGINYFLIPVYGIFAASLSIFLSQFVVCIVRMIQSEKFIQLSNKKEYIVSSLVLCVGTFYSSIKLNTLFSISIWTLIILLLLIILNMKFLKGSYNMIMSKLTSHD